MGLLQNANAIPTAAGAAGFYTYQIANSCRFDSASSSYLYRSPGTASLNTKSTISCWLKRSNLANMGEASGSPQTIIGSATSEAWEFYDGAHDDKIKWSGGGGGRYITTGDVYRDTSAWYHMVFRYDSTQGAAADRVKIYKNGDLIAPSTYTESSYAASSEATAIGNGDPTRIGRDAASADNYFDGYMAEVIFTDGQSYAPTEFGETKNGVWIAKEPSVTFGNNGFHLKFEASGDLGNDSSGNNNDFTASGLGTDHQTLDSPTFSATDGNGGNFATLGPLWKNPTTLTLSEGNLRGTTTANAIGGMSNWAVPDGGKWFWEVNYSQQAGTSANFLVGIAYANASLTTVETVDQVLYYSENGMKIIESVRSSYGVGFDSPSGDAIVGIAVDRVNDTLNFSYNGSWQGAFDISGLSSNEFFPFTMSSGSAGTQGWTYNFGQDGTFAGNITAGGNADENGYGNFKYSVPSGFLALCSGNLPTADAVDPAQTDDDYPQKLLGMENWVGTGSTLSVTGLGFQPDFVYFKSADQGGVYSNWWTYDSTRGVTKSIQFNEVDVETTRTTGLTAFGADGVSVGASTGSHYGAENTAGTLITIICIRVNGGTTAANSVGDTDSVTQVDPSGAFSIVTYTGTGSATTIGHGLSAAPDCIIVKDRGATNNWAVYHGGVASDAQTDYLLLDSNAAVADDSTYWNDTTPTTSVFSIGTNADVNTNTNTYVAYAFANIEGYTKFSTYVGNGNADGPFVYCGFLPKVIWLKRYDSTGNWNCYKWDYTSVNSGYISLGMNEIDTRVEVNTTDSRSTSTPIDFLSNGFKIRVADGDINVDTGKYLVMAWASNPFQYSSAF